MFINEKADMGQIPMETLEAWASRDERIDKMRDENTVQNACAMWEKKSKADGVPAELIESAKKKFKENFKRNLMSNMAQSIVKEYFNNGKTANELLDSEEWRQQMVKSAVDEEVTVMVIAAKYMQLFGRDDIFYAIISRNTSAFSKGKENDDDASDSDSASHSVNDEA